MDDPLQVAVGFVAGLAAGYFLYQLLLIGLITSIFCSL